MLLQVADVPPCPHTCRPWKRQPARTASLGHAAACKPLAYTAEGLCLCAQPSSLVVMIASVFFHHLSKSP